MNPTVPTAPKPSHAGWWRAATIACLLVIALGLAAGASMYEQFKAQVSHLQTQVKGTARIKYLAVLLDQKQAPALLATFDPQDGALQLQRLNTVKEGREDSMQLWALAPGVPPRSLGVLDSSGKTHQLRVDEAALAPVTQLAISVEDKGGVAEARGPRLPYLFTGALVQKAL